MLRLLIAALAVAIALHLWGEVSSRVLPWPAAKSRQAVVMPLESSTSGRGLEGSAAVVESVFPRGSSFAPPPRSSSEDLLAANSSDWPLYAFQRSPHGLTPRAESAHFALNIVLGLVAAVLVAAVFRDESAKLRRVGILALIALFLVLMTDVSHGLWMEWPAGYVAVLATDHVVGTLVAAATAGAVLRLWKVGRPRAAATTVS